MRSWPHDLCLQCLLSYDGAVLYLFIAVALGVICSAWADSRNRNPVAWFFIGGFSFALGMILLARLPKLKAPEDSKFDGPPLAQHIRRVDGAVGIAEQSALVCALISLVFVGSYQFVASRFLGGPPEWSGEAVKDLVFICAMMGAALSAQKGQMISMDFLARKFSQKNQIILRICVSLMVIFACYLLYKGGMFARSVTGTEDYELLKPQDINVVLPVSAVLIALHYLLHSLSDISFLASGQLPAEEEGPKGH